MKDKSKKQPSKIERKKAEKVLEKQKEQARSYLDIAGTMLAAVDADEKITMINKKGCKHLGYKERELIGKNWFDILVPKRVKKDTRGVFNKLIAGKIKPVEFYENPLLTKKDEERLFAFHNTTLKDSKGKINGVLFSAEDITERKKAEEKLKKAYENLKESQDQILQSEKLASIGQLATGVVHEINNPLTVILGEAELLLKERQKVKEIKDALKTILEQGERIKTITQRLLEFSRKKEVIEKPFDINDALKKSLSLLSYQTKREDVKIIENLDSNIPKILGDKNRIQEAFLNIMLNAIQAMEEGGKLIIRVHREKITENGRRQTDKLKQGGELAVIEFEDTGKGMDEETLKKIFDPFFSTKEKGTGLGLSVCYRIIEDHKGIIEARSKLGEGSTLIVKLPIMGGRK